MARDANLIWLGHFGRRDSVTGMRPPEDSGGPWGCAEKLEALPDPAHEYHEEALDALGGDHDPNAQPNIEMIDASFAALAKNGRRAHERLNRLRQRCIPSALAV